MQNADEIRVLALFPHKSNENVAKQTFRFLMFSFIHQFSHSVLCTVQSSLESWIHLLFFFYLPFNPVRPKLLSNKMRLRIQSLWCGARRTCIHFWCASFFLSRKLNENKPHSSECGKTKNGLESGYDEVGVDYGLIENTKHFLVALSMCAPPSMPNEKRRENLKFQLSRFRCELCIWSLMYCSYVHIPWLPSEVKNWIPLALMYAANWKKNSVTSFRRPKRTISMAFVWKRAST